jgi:3-hydroxymyristoyl/3-hydroxydecanoyl-(acyl carrier protein) dehydratase
MRPAPFTARWESAPQVAGAFEARLRLDDESLFAGHYPGAPIFPGNFLVEALFQAASVALDSVRLEEIVACRFHSPLFPGDEVVASFTLKDAGAGATWVEATVHGRAPAAQVTLLVSSSTARRDVDPVTAPSAGPVARVLDAAFIRGALPHRPPALLVDEASVVGPSALVGRKRIAIDEPCYARAEASSTPSSSAAYPASLIVESFCQSCGLLRAATAPAREQHDKLPVVAKLANLRFGAAPGPGDTLEHHVRMISRLPEGAVFSGQTVASGRVVLQVGRVIAALAPRTASR